MGKDGNTIEIEIDAAATVAAAKTAGEANAKLVKFDQALGLFRDNVGLVSKTTEDVATRMGDFNTILGKFADSLVTNLADMQTSVVQKIEPHLERELENMVNRVLNKVEAKTGTTGESRSRSEAKQGAAAPAVPVTPAGQRVGVSQDTDYKKPDYRIKENIVERIVSDLDEATGKQVERILTTRNTRVIKDDHDQYEDEEGNLVDKTSTITTYTSEVNKANKVIAEGAKVEKDRGIAIRKEITGALIGLHVMKVVSQYSQVFNAGFMTIAAAMGHLLNNLLLPMMPMFTQIAQVIHMIANVVTMLPMPIRQLLGAFIMFKAASMLAASMPFKDIKDGFGGIKSAMESSATGIQKFIKLLAGFVDFMMSGQGRGAVSWIGSGLGKVGGAISGGAKKLLGRAGGGPVLGHGAYIVGEKGPEIFVPKTSGSIIPNHKIGRADGIGDLAAAPTGSQAPILPDIGSTLLGGAMGAGLGYMFTGSPLVAAGGGVLGAAAGASGADIIGTIAGGVGAMMSNDTVQGIMGGMHLLTNTLAAFLAPIAPMLGVIAGVVGVASGVRGGLGGGGDGGRTAETVATVGKAQLKQTAAMSYGVQNTVNAGTRGTSSSLMALLLRMNGCIKVAPCSPDAFGFTAAITSALPTALTLALGALAATITYTIITNGIVPIATPIATTITYTIKTVGEIPITSNIERFITWTRRVVGEIPDAISKEATITYNIVKNGIEPTVTNVTAKIIYLVEKVGEVPTVQNVTAKITYAIETIGKLPVVEGITSWIDVKINELTEAEYQKLKTAVEAKAAANPPTITAKVLADGTVEGGVPTLDVTAKVKSIDTTGLTPAEKTISDVTAKVTTANVDSVKGVEIPAKGAIEGLSGTDIVEVSPGVYAYKNALDVPAKVKLGLITPEEYAAYLKDLAEKADAAKPKIPTVLTTDGKLTSVDGKPLTAEVPAVVKVVQGKNGAWEISSDGSIKYLGKVIEIPTELSNPKPLDPTKIEPLKVEVAPAAPSEPVWKGWGRTAAGFGIVGIVAYFAEWNSTGTAPEVGSFLTKFLVGGIALLGMQQIAGALATAFGGTVVGTAVAGAIGSAITLAFTTLVAVPLAFALATDLINALAEAFKTGDWSKLDFKTPVLRAAYAAGEAVGEFFRTLGQRVGNYLQGHGFRSNEEIQNLLKAGQTMPEIDANPDLKLSDLGIELDASGNFVRNLDKFNADFKQTIAGGVPVDVKIDTDSVTRTIESVASTVNPGGTYTYNPTGSTQPLGTNPTDASGTPIQGPLKPDGAFALGGSVAAGGTYLVGEKGPELFRPAGSGEIIPNNKLGSLGGGGNVTVNQTFHVTTNNPRELTDTVMKELKMELARVKM